MAEVQRELSTRADDYADDEYSFDNWKDEIQVFELGETVAVKLERKVTATVGLPVEIPAPLPGESVTDYAKRITA